MPQKSILLVEDDKDIRQVLQEVLEIEGYSVQAANNGQEALKLLNGQEDISIILLDLMMPVMNGWEFLDAFSKQYSVKQVKIIVMSAVADPIKLKGKPVDACLKKPLDVDTLLSLLEQPHKPAQTYADRKAGD